jgi:gamma-glutamyltranspeptidase/glutathione hydrolase
MSGSLPLPAAGAAAPHEGSRAAALASQVAAAGGLLTSEDLAHDLVLEREPLEAGYRGCTLLTNPVPSLGGSLLALSLRLLEETLADGADAQTRVATLVAVMQEVDRLRAAGVHWDGDVVQMEPGFGDAEVRALGKRWPVNRWPARDVYFGGVHAVAPLSGHTGADPRRGGSSAVF